MINIAKLNDDEREILFANAAFKAGIANPAIVEKDFWVCFILDYLFHKSPWPDCFIFKGGTSLSKAYHIIERFSEDIDLILDWRLIGYGINDPWIDRTRNQQNKFNRKVVDDASAFLSNTFVQKMETDIKKMIGQNVVIKMDLDDPEQCTVNFFYPHVFETDYLRREIRLEIGPLAEWVPSHGVAISPIAAEQYPGAFNQKDTVVQTIDAERTFWEKATILHKTAASYKQKGIPDRYARHYYDLYKMCLSGIKESAFARKDLLERDIKFKMKFYYSKNASYETAHVGTLRLVPDDDAIKSLSIDYDHMKNMIYGEIPSFDHVIQVLADLEKQINNLI